MYLARAFYVTLNLARMAVPTKHTWSITSIRELVQDKFGKRPCYFQIQVAQSLYARKDVVACAPTTIQKTLRSQEWMLYALCHGYSSGHKGLYCKIDRM